MSTGSPVGSDDPTRSILETAHEAFISMDAGGFITDVNAQAESTFGWLRDEILGSILSETIIPPRYRDAHVAGLERFLATGEGPLLGRRFEIEALHRDGHEFPIEITISARRGGDSCAFYAFLHDISERRLNERFLAAQHATATVLAEADTVADAVPRLLPALGAEMGWEYGAYWVVGDGHTLTCRATWTVEGLDLGAFDDATRGSSFDYGVGLPGRVLASGQPALIEVVAADPNFPRASQAAEVGLTTAVGLPLLAGGEVRGVMEYFTRQVRHAGPELIDMMGALAMQIGRFLKVLSDRTELLERLERLSLTDELTGLRNRRGWNEGLAREIARARRRGEPLCVALLDLDRFKAFNDERGHQAGDWLLRELAGRWSDLLRVTDLLARYGGEEFTVAFTSWPVANSLTVVDRLRAATPGGLTCSAGLTAWREDESPQELIGRADAALYEAKRGGRNRTVVAG